MSLSASRNVFQTARMARLTKPTAVRFASSKSLQDTFAELVPQRQELLKELKTNYGSRSLGEIKVDNLIGGMRGLKVMLWDPSVLDASEGIRFWGRTIPECQEVLPAAPGGKEMLPESMLWYLLTGQVPSAEQSQQFTQDLAARSSITPELEKIIDSFPKTLHPMTQFVAATAVLNHDSAFAKAYSTGIKKTEYWKPVLEDSLNLCAKVYTIAGRIYNNVYRNGEQGAAIDKSKDLSYNFAHATGFGDKPAFIEMVRLYNALHTDHEGGNVSAHTSHLVGSALSDPFLSFSAALSGLAGPLHGLANQEVLSFILGMVKEVGENPSDEKIKEQLWKVLKSGRVVPGYGHAVLRKPDPRFAALQDFGLRYKIDEDPIFKIVDKLSHIAPGVLKEHGKTSNPFPNVDAASGSLLYHYGMTQQQFYTVLFGCSRAMGCVGQLVWSRALGLSIERPKSMSMEALKKSLDA